MRIHLTATIQIQAFKVGDHVEVNADETEYHGMKGKIVKDIFGDGAHFQVDLDNYLTAPFQKGELKAAK